MKTVLQAKDLSKVYELGETKVHAVKDIDLEIMQGVFYSIIGKSGSGKSTLLHLLAGTMQPTTGKVFIEGQNIHGMNDYKLSLVRRRKIGFVFQSYNLLPEFSVEENIKLPLCLDKAQLDQAYFDELLCRMEISHLKSKFPYQLSGGEQQRVAIARALIAKPRIVFADEPTGNLDQESGARVFGLLKELQKELNQTIVLVTHDLDLAMQAEQIIKLKDGVIVR